MARTSIVRAYLSVPRALLGLLLVYSLLLANWWWPVVRLEWRALNYAVMTLAFLIPLTCALLAWWLKPQWLRPIVSLLLLPFGIAGLLLASFTGIAVYDTLVRGGDPAFLLTDSVKLKGSFVRAYRTDCGATCDYGLVVRQEKRILPGINIVRAVYARTHPQGGKLQVLDSSRVLVMMHWDGGLMEGPVLEIESLLW